MTATRGMSTSPYSEEFMTLTENGGEVGRLMRSVDWSQTSVGPFEQWPQSLKTALSICLGSKFPMFVWWGKDLTVFYNDAYIPFVGLKHPEFFARKASEQWAEIWSDLQPLTDHVFKTGQATWAESMLLFMTRKGYLEETYFTFSYSPIRDESGAVAGIINPCQETTERIIGERRLCALRDLGSADVKDLDQMAQVSTSIFAKNLNDIPFAMIYLLDPDEKNVRLCGGVGVKENSPLAPQSYDLSNLNDKWPFAEAFKKRQPQKINNLREDFFEFLPEAPYAEKPDSAYVFPIIQMGYDKPSGFLILGISSRLSFDEQYQGFFDLLGKQVAIHTFNAHAFEEERKRIEALAEIDRAKTAFFSNISHELRTPLTLLLGPAEEALNDMWEMLSPKNRDRMDLVYRNALRLQKLVNTLLDFSRVEAGRMQPTYVQVDLAKFTAEIASSFETAMSQAGIEYKIICKKSDKEFFVDPDLWERILLNLISNALKFTFKGKITVELHPYEEGVELQVIDTGIGIAEKDLPHIFERFHRVEGAKSRTHEGSGIGLALVKELVKLHGGVVSIQSQVDKGTTFTVRIPAGTAHLPRERVFHMEKTLVPNSNSARAFIDEALHISHRKPEVTKPSVPFSKDRPQYTIILADDNPDMRDYIYGLLTEAGQNWEVLATANGNEALKLARLKTPDLILSDVMMPELDGFGLLKAIRNDEALRATPIIFLSARAGEGATIEGLEHKVDDYLIKPFSSKELIARVSTQLEMSVVRREAALQSQANQAKNQFLANMSHEIRTPISSILGFAELMLDPDIHEDEKRDCVKVILKNGRLLTRIIDEILDLSKIESDRLVIENIEFSLAELIDNVTAFLSLQAQAKDLALKVTYDGSSIPKQVVSDPGRLRQILLNVMGNAIKFTAQGQIELKVKYLSEERMLEFTVKDSGIGLTEEQQKNLFKRFSQADNSMTRKYGGTGLGLIVSQKIARALGGDLSLLSSSVNQGSTFVVTVANRALLSQRLPDFKFSRPEMESLVKDVDKQVLNPSTPLKESKILVVDDSPDNRLLVGRILNLAGAEVTSAENGEEGVKAALANDYDVILMDLQMPVKDGFQATAELRQHAFKKPIIAFTAHAMRGDRERCMRSGFDEHLGKPIDKRLLVSTIANFVKVSRGQRARSPNLNPT